MDILRTTFLMGKYELAMSLINQLPSATLASPDRTLLHVAADVADSGEATRIAIELGYGRLVGSSARAYNNETPVHVAIRRGNLHGFRVMMGLITADSVTQTVVDECAMLAAEFNQHQILAELLRLTLPAGHAIEHAMLDAARLQYVQTCKVLFDTYKELLGPLLPRVAGFALRQKDRRPEMAGFVRRMVVARPNSVRFTEHEKGRTALHVAANYRNPEALAFTRFLIDNGAHLGDIDKAGLTPLQVAFNRKNIDCLCMLLSVPNSPIMWKMHTKSASIYNRVVTGSDVQLLDMMLAGNRQLRADHELIKCLLMAKNDVLFRHALETYPQIAAARGRLGRNILMWAIFDRDVGLYHINMILEYGEFDVDAKDAMNNTALHYAAQRGDVSIILRLLEMERVSSSTLNTAECLPIDCCSGVPKPVMLRMLRAHRGITPKLSTMMHLCANAKSALSLIKLVGRPPTMADRMLETQRFRRGRAIHVRRRFG